MKSLYIGVALGILSSLSLAGEPRPVFAKDFPDPFVLRVGEDYYAYSTNARGFKVPVLHSRDLVHWEEKGDALPRVARWAVQDGLRNWAPGALQVGDRFFLYYTTHYRDEGGQAISFGVSRSPTGPFIDSTRGPLVYQKEQGGSIDPEVFTDEDGTHYLLWKSDANSRGLPSALYAQELAPNGRSLRGKPHRLLAIDQEWEEPLIENPSILRHGDRYYLIYSANWWHTEHYAVGYATGPSPLGPFTKQEGGPVLKSHGGRERGPGGAAFFRDAAGAPWIAYHAWSAPRINYGAGGARSLHLARVRFEEGRLRFDRWDGRGAGSAEVGGRRSEVGGQKSEVGGKK